MEYSAGDHVVYGGTQICTYEKTEEKTFDGVNFREYAVFRPVDQTGNASYFVEKDKVCERVRPLLTKDQVLSVIDSMPEIETEWIDNKVERRAAFTDVLHSDDYKRVIGMIKSICMERHRRSQIGKGLPGQDERAFETANRLLCQEFSMVLGISPNDVDTYIEKRLGAPPVWA
ncbi:MAG: hypothetical protein K6G68_06460 [Oscillospiraceae bacterium]|nr:hypothetical protein [Oscillospiraceae bacterium]MBQ4486156.1 hypothetical protein [Oscillospiraceae bacterium]MCR5806657.1 hypothetical protein [Oscillospiraceae bacterium]